MGKLYSRQEFEVLRESSMSEMAADHTLKQQALDTLIKADHYRWIHQTNWFGEPVLNLPQDMFAIQEIVFNTRPQYVIECGVAWGGGMLFYATLLSVLGGKQVIGIDTYIPDDLTKRIISSPVSGNDMIRLINGSSVDKGTVLLVKNILEGCRDVLVILDSNHTHDHVLKELEIYSEFVGEGHYLICGDTVIEDMPKQEHRKREWGPGNNPKTALVEFMSENKEFTIDQNLEKKLLFTCNPSGYLKRSHVPEAIQK